MIVLEFWASFNLNPVVKNKGKTPGIKQKLDGLIFNAFTTESCLRPASDFLVYHSDFNLKMDLF